MRSSIETSSNTRWYSFVYEFRSAAEAPIELIEVLERERDWSYALFFPSMEASPSQPAMPPSVCLLCKSVLRIYRIEDGWQVTCQEVPLAAIDRIVLQLYLAKCSLRILWRDGSALLRFPVHGAERVAALCERLAAGPGWERTEVREPVLGYGVEITLRRRSG